ncbi:MAG: alpha/beta hydrolase [Acholeplasmatales bacterium]|nr:alpha/beta hydrolase [Acholeplasmatales bacterium]
MDTKIYNIYKETKIQYLKDTKATLTSYIPEYNTEMGNIKRHTVLVIPGGGYDRVSKREGEPVALYYLSLGYNVFVLDYTTKEKEVRKFPYQLLESMAAVILVNKITTQYDGTRNDISVVGFSAGGHLACSLGLLGNNEKFKKMLDVSEDIKVKNMILAYPVISHNVPTHEGSFNNLVSTEYSYSDISLEQYVKEDSPSLFIWATSTDESVPIQNTLVLCHKYAVLKKKFELHIYEKGNHGLSLATMQVCANYKELDPNIKDWIRLSSCFIEKQE